MAGWASLKELVREEFAQSLQEGKDRGAVEAIRVRQESAGEDETELAALHAGLLALPVRKDFPFQEPGDLAGIRALRPNAPRGSRKLAPESGFDEGTLADKLHGAWLGRCAGCALGKPVERLMSASGGRLSWERQKNYLTAISPDEWPLRDYFPQHSPATDVAPDDHVACPLSTRERIAFMESDDDIRYTVLGQIIMAKHGADFCTSHVAHTWFEYLGYSQVCTAETQAYRNLVIRYDHFRHEIPDVKTARELDMKTDWEWVAHHLNPYREFIGAQIRVDSYGYAAPGHPELAAEFAWRDARMTHVKNGIYGAMFCAAMIAAAFATDDVREIIEAGLAEIPRTSRLHDDIRRVMGICEKHGNVFDRFEEVLREVHAGLGHYHAVHTNNNAALCVVALLLSGGDFHRGITLAVMGGWDTDCNGATVGSIVGAIAGAQRVPSHWTNRLNDTLNSWIVEYHPVTIGECARRSMEIVRKPGIPKQ
ncbi:MAG: ADP-ribosylglycohydrolase family protein [Opitutaceae bacterium]|jgi:ADP-ribosylglycohydrolase|nr:ADP-ribosylglycohydrolase family protein [Opitutaceae bacterium]